MAIIIDKFNVARCCSWALMYQEGPKHSASRATEIFQAHADIPEFKPCFDYVTKPGALYFLMPLFVCILMGSPNVLTTRIKVIKRVSYDYRSFNNFRRRILFAINANRV